MVVELYNELNKENANRRIDKYLETKTLKRLQGKGIFCGMDYVGIKELVPIELYTRLDHSRNVAYTASKLTDDFNIVLAGLFHDVGTLSFSHVNSFKKGDALTQEDDELDVRKVISGDEELLTYLHEDKINIDDVVDASKYPLIDKKIPCLCLDRADGILTTDLIWTHIDSFDKVKELYSMLCYIESLNGMVVNSLSSRFKNFNGELFINEHFTETDYEDFYSAINIYSKKLLSKESRYMTSLLGLTLNYYEDIGLFTDKDLFDLSEEEIIARIKDSKYKDIWQDVTAIDKVSYAKDLDDGLALIVKPKIRQTNPLCMGQMCLCEIDDVAGEFYRELNDLYNDIELLDRPITSNLSNSTVKILSKYRRK